MPTGSEGSWVSTGGLHSFRVRPEVAGRMPQDLVLVVDEGPGRGEVTVVGELDAYTAPRLKKVLARLCGSEGRRVVVDLARTSFIDAAGLGVLVAAYKRCQARGGGLSVRAPSGTVRRLLEMTGLTAVLPVEGSPDPAQLSVSGEG